MRFLNFAYLTASLLVVSLIACASQVNAQATIKLPADVAHVVSGGRWKTASNEGFYRVIIQTEGGEHVVSRAQVDWVAHPRSPTELPGIITSTFAETGSWRLDHPRFTKVRGIWRIELSAIETHHFPPLKGVWYVELGKPGVLKTSLLTRPALN